MSARGLRRHYREVRVDRWRRRLRQGYGSFRALIPSAQWVERHARLRARTARVCSCALCSGFRHAVGLKEIVADIGFKEQLDEVLFLGSLW